ITQLAKSMNVKVEPFRLSEAVQIALRQLGRQWSSSGKVDLIRAAVEDVPLVLGDRGGVAQVLQQLLDNAIKFSPQGGAINITADQFQDSICVYVRDKGIGIPEDQMEQIFQAFYQVNSSTTRPFGGAGVGLAIVKLLLDAMGSKIQVTSKPGEGSTF